MKRVIASWALGLCLLAAQEAAAVDVDVDAFLKLDGVPGEVTFTGYGGWIDVRGYSIGHGAVSSTGAPGFRPLQVRKRVDKTSPVLAAAAATGGRFKMAVLDVMRTASSGQTYLGYRIVLHDVSLRSYAVGDVASQASLPVTYDGDVYQSAETVELGYSKIEWYAYAAPGATPVQMRFDLAKGTLY